MQHLRTEADLDTALACLVKLDQRFTQALALSGRPPLRKRPDGFTGLAAIVVAQQLSTASANAILGRLKAALDPLDHAAVLRARPAKLARIGLSAPKIRTLKAIARAVDDGAIDKGVTKSGYPPSLTTLVEGAVDKRDPKAGRIYFLRRVPADPVSGQEWGLRSYASPAGEPKPGEDVFDVFSRSDAIGLNGIAYKDW